ncbi:MAG: esterase/lipase family protein [Verrucomicrobiales bacterium]|nr:hypothetical protein [Verrucomicrobiota bacterium JB025]
MHAIARILLPLAITAVLCQCGAPQPPTCGFLTRRSSAPAPTLIEVARTEWTILANPARRADWPRAQTSYNTAVGKLFDQLRCGSGTWDQRAAAIGTTIAPPSDHQSDLALVDALFPATKVKTDIVNHHHITDGIGVPLVGWRKTTPVGIRRPDYLLPNGLPYITTAIVSFDTGRPTWIFPKRWYQDSIRVGSATLPLAADWTAPNAFYWRMCELDNLKLQNVFLPGRFSEETELYFVEPYDPGKIPVVFVHGLVSSPDAFKNMINDLSPEPWFRKNYQIWLFSYPTGNPWIYSSMNFRKTMREAIAYARSNGGSKTIDDMVVVTHSMGGLVTRSSVTDPGTRYYHSWRDEPIDALDASEKTKQFIREASLFTPLTEPDRVVFCAVPHRGSPMATFRFATALSRLIRLPKTLTVDLLDTTLQSVGDAVQGTTKPHIPTSINSLSPADRNTRVLGSLPLPSHIRFHSIIGDRGKGNSPESSDGVVPYWSSHVEPVESELIVPSAHGVPDDPQASIELQRILKLHLQQSR